MTIWKNKTFEITITEETAELIKQGIRDMWLKKDLRPLCDKVWWDDLEREVNEVWEEFCRAEHIVKIVDDYEYESLLHSMEE